MATQSESANSINPAFRGKHWCFTLNNYTQEECGRIEQWCRDHTSYAIIGREIGESGTPHLQAYFELRKRSRLEQVRRLGSGVLDRCHFIESRGNARSNIEYCSKSDPSPWTCGEPAVPPSAAGGEATRQVLMPSNACHCFYCVYRFLNEMEIDDPFVRHQVSQLNMQEEQVWDHEMDVSVSKFCDARRHLWME